MNKTVRITALILALVAVLSLAPAVLASGLTVGFTRSKVIENNNAVSIGLSIRNDTGAAIEIVQIGVKKGILTSAVLTSSATNLAAGASKTFTVTGSVSESAAVGDYSGQQLTVYYYDSHGDLKDQPTGTFSIRKTTAATAEEEEGGKDSGDNASLLHISALDAAGLVVPAPTGDAGDSIRIRLPITCVSGGVSNIMLSPVISTDIEAFPFLVERVDYTIRHDGALYYGQVIEFDYDLTLSKKATTGLKKVDFAASYYDSTGAYQTSTLSVFVNVKRGASPASTNDFTSTPRLIIESYSLSAEKLYAGDVFKLTLKLRNTSSSSTVRNLQVTVKDALGVVLPADSGSNTMFVGNIAKEESNTQVISLQTGADAEAKAYTLNVTFDYETTEKDYSTEETITLPINQKIRLKFDDPVIYDEGFVGQSCAMYCAMYNLGKAGISNCMVDVEGEGLEIEESYFGGNVAAGGTMRADFNVIPASAGDIAGNVVITYEDSFGQQYTEKLPFNLFVNEEIISEYDPSMEEGMMEEPKKPFPLWAWFAIFGPMAIAGIVMLIVLLKKKRARELTDLEEADV